VLAHQADEAREFGTVDRFRHVGPAHVVDDDRRRQGGKEVPQFGQIGRLEIDNDMPAEWRDAAGDLEQFVFRREVDETLDEVEANAAHAGPVQRLKVGIADVAPHRGDATRHAVRMNERIDEGAVVGAVAGCLDDDVAGETEPVAQREQLLARGIAGRVFALGREREALAGTENMTMGIDGPRRQAELRDRRIGKPIEPARRFLETHELTFSQKPGQIPAAARVLRASATG